LNCEDHIRKRLRVLGAGLVIGWRTRRGEREKRWVRMSSGKADIKGAP